MKDRIHISKVRENRVSNLEPIVLLSVLAGEGYVGDLNVVGVQRKRQHEEQANEYT